MSKKKSLGSSPIGFSTSSRSKMGFIPDLGVSDRCEEEKKEVVKTENRPSSHLSIVSSKPAQTSKPEPKCVEKKIVSYNLEVDLIARLKAVADDKNIYYSTLVSNALKYWLANKC